MNVKREVCVHSGQLLEGNKGNISTFSCEIMLLCKSSDISPGEIEVGGGRGKRDSEKYLFL